MLAIAELSPLFLAVMICWIFSVCIHEFAHAVVAYLGGDTSVRDRGYLGLNIFAFIHPVTSILLPVIFLIIGGVPLPGGAVLIEEHRLRSRHWRAAVSAAGPASNFILFLILAWIVHPGTGIVDPTNFNQPTWVMLLGAMTVLQLFAVLLNLLPIPPLDGFGIIEPYLPDELRDKARSIGWGGLIILFILFWNKSAMRAFMDAINRVMIWLGLPFESTWRFYNIALFGSSE